jgi:hypothetical protein
VSDLSLEWNTAPINFTLGVVVQNGTQRMCVQATTCHVLGTSRRSSVYHQRAFSLLCCDVCRYGTGTPRADDNDVEIPLFHFPPPAI